MLSAARISTGWAVTLIFFPAMPPQKLSLKVRPWTVCPDKESLVLLLDLYGVETTMVFVVEVAITTGVEVINGIGHVVILISAEVAIGVEIEVVTVATTTEMVSVTKMPTHGLPIPGLQQIHKLEHQPILNPMITQVSNNKLIKHPNKFYTFKLVGFNLNLFKILF